MLSQQLYVILHDLLLYKLVLEVGGSHLSDSVIVTNQNVLTPDFIFNFQ